MTDNNLQILRAILFEGSGGRRFTQDSPVLPDVWLAYGEDPTQPRDLLITPHYGVMAGEAAVGLRAVLPQGRVAHLAGVVVATVRFDELVGILLPQTKWFQEQLAALAVALGRGTGAPLLPLTAADRRVIAARVAEVGQGQRPRGAILPAEVGVVPLGLAWLIQVIAAVHDPAHGAGDSAAAIRAFARMIADAPVGSKPLAGRIALNRAAEAAAKPMDSALAIKADAARLLFNVMCKDISWAVIDSGIDDRHPAFEAHDDGATRMTVGADSKPVRGRSRVLRTYDFTRIRGLLDPVRIAALFDDAAPPSPEQRQLQERIVANLTLQGVAADRNAAARLVLQVKARLADGLEIDWALLEPLLADPDPAPPENGHGTHVAGILAADWRKPGDGEGGADDDSQMQGICPDIRLIDLRVLDSEGVSQDFEVIAALQFVRFLNSRGDRRVVHGVNLSISTMHDVTAYACGSTIVCQECDRTWASGVVLVAAAGNHGHQRYRLADGAELGGYNGTSITDPGNAEGVITVGSTHRSRPHQFGVSYFSSRGPTGDGRRKPDLVAPGERIDGPLPGGTLGTGDGTSLATPHVSGAAAMLIARHPELEGRPDRIKQILCDTATDLGREPYFQGAGMLDILRALQAV